MPPQLVLLPVIVAALGSAAWTGSIPAPSLAAQVPREMSAHVYLPWVGRDTVPRLDPRSNVGGATWSVAGEGDLAVMGVGLRLVTVDIHDAAAPRLLGEVGPLADLPYGLALAGDTLFVANGFQGLRIYDVSAPAYPREIGAFATTDAAYDVTLDGARAYVSAGSQGLVMLDIADPTQPRWVGTFNGPGSVRQSTVMGQRVLVASGKSGLFLVDIRYPARPFPLGAFNPAGEVNTVALVGTHAIVPDFTDLVVLDVAAAGPPREVGRITLELLDGDAELAAVGSAVYASGDDALIVVDLTDPAHPRELPSVTPDTRELLPLAVSGPRLLAGDGYVGVLHVLDVANPAAPAVVGRYLHDVLGEVFRLGAEADHLYVWATDWWVIAGDRVPPARIGLMADPPVAGDMAARGAQAYLGGDQVFTVVDVSDASQPRRIGTTYEGWVYSAVAVAGPRLVALAGAVPPMGGEVRDELVVVEVAEPAVPHVAGHLDVAGSLTSVAATADGHWAYVSAADCRGLTCLDPHGGLIHVVDLADPTSPKLHDTIPTAAPAADLAVADGRLYAAHGRGMMAFDLADPANPRWLASFGIQGGGTSGYALTVLPMGRWVALGYDDGVRIVDTAGLGTGGPTPLTVVATLHLPEPARELARAGDVLWVGQDQSGMVGLSLFP
jgi:hypothetical protein